MVEIKSKVTNETGLHARPASLFTKAASKFKSDIDMYKNDDRAKKFNPKSILSVLSMGAEQGDTIVLQISGEDEELAATNLKVLIETGLE